MGKIFNDGQTRAGLFANYYDRDRVNAQDDKRWADSDFRSRIPADSPFAGNTAFRNNSVNSPFGQYDVRGDSFSGLTDSRGEFETFPSGDARCEFEVGGGLCGAVDGNGTIRQTSTLIGIFCRNCDVQISTATSLTSSIMVLRALPRLQPTFLAQIRDAMAQPDWVP